MKELIDKVLDWANSKNLLRPECMNAQLVKVYEEFGELGGAILKNNKEAQKDALGDCLVTLIILAKQKSIEVSRLGTLDYVNFYYIFDSNIKNSAKKHYKTAMDLQDNHEKSVSLFILAVSKVYYIDYAHVQLAYQGLILLSECLGYNLEECLSLAYDVISKRKGKTENGIFIKEE